MIRYYTESCQSGWSSCSLTRAGVPRSVSEPRPPVASLAVLAVQLRAQPRFLRLQLRRECFTEVFG